MPSPRWTNADLLALYASGALDDLPFTATPDCACHDEAWRRASATQRPQYGQVAPDEVIACHRQEVWAGGLIRLSCSNSAGLFVALSECGFQGEDAMDAEIVRRFVVAERMARVQAKGLAGALAILNLRGAAA